MFSIICLNLFCNSGHRHCVEITVQNRARHSGNVGFSLDYVILEEIKDLLKIAACFISP